MNNEARNLLKMIWAIWPCLNIRTELFCVYDKAIYAPFLPTHSMPTKNLGTIIALSTFSPFLNKGLTNFAFITFQSSNNINCFKLPQVISLEDMIMATEQLYVVKSSIMTPWCSCILQSFRYAVMCVSTIIVVWKVGHFTLCVRRKGGRLLGLKEQRWYSLIKRSLCVLVYGNRTER